MKFTPQHPFWHVVLLLEPARAAISGEQQCTCNCCQVAEQPDVENQWESTGDAATCVAASQTSYQCPQQCYRSMYVSDGPLVEYSRHCIAACLPTTSTPGAKCTDKFSLRGKSVTPALKVGGAHMTLAGIAQGPQAAASAMAATIQPGGDLKASWDLQKLIEERLRSESGAAVAQGAAAGERVRLLGHLTSRNVAIVKQAKQDTGPAESSLDGAVTAADGNATLASEFAREASMVYSEARAEVRPLLRSTAALARRAIEQQAAEAAVEEASARALRRGWDKPSNWWQVLAYRAAEPYAQASVALSDRASQYEFRSQALRTAAVEGPYSRPRHLEGNAKELSERAEVLRQSLPRLEKEALKSSERAAVQVSKVFGSPLVASN